MMDATPASRMGELGMLWLWSWLPVGILLLGLALSIAGLWMLAHRHA